MSALEDLDEIQNYMADKINIMKIKIDMEKFVDRQFAKIAGDTVEIVFSNNY